MTAPCVSYTPCCVPPSTTSSITTLGRHGGGCHAVQRCPSRCATRALGAAAGACCAKLVCAVTFLRVCVHRGCVWLPTDRQTHPHIMPHTTHTQGQQCGAADDDAAADVARRVRCGAKPRSERQRSLKHKRTRPATKSVRTKQRKLQVRVAGGVCVCVCVRVCGWLSACVFGWRVLALSRPPHLLGPLPVLCRRTHTHTHTHTHTRTHTRTNTTTTTQAACRHGPARGAACQPAQAARPPLGRRRCRRAGAACAARSVARARAAAAVPGAGSRVAPTAGRAAAGAGRGLHLGPHAGLDRRGLASLDTK
jgi:hypothetical protein